MSTRAQVPALDTDHPVPSLTPHRLEELRSTEPGELVGLYQHGRDCRFVLVFRDPRTEIITVVSPFAERCLTPAQWVEFCRDRHLRRMHLTGRDRKLVETARGRETDMRKAAWRINQLKRRSLQREPSVRVRRPLFRAKVRAFVLPLYEAHDLGPHVAGGATDEEERPLTILLAHGQHVRQLRH